MGLFVVVALYITVPPGHGRKQRGCRWPHNSFAQLVHVPANNLFLLTQRMWKDTLEGA